MPMLGADVDFVARDGDWLGNLEQAFFGHHGGIVDVVHVFEDDGELVAANAGDGVAGAQGVGEAARDQAQQVVADIVPERVVDGLEVVEVDEHHHRAFLALPGARDDLFEPLVKEVAVVQLGHVVEVGQAVELDLDPLALADFGLQFAFALLDAVEHGVEGRRQRADIGQRTDFGADRVVAQARNLRAGVRQRAQGIGNEALQAREHQVGDGEHGEHDRNGERQVQPKLVVDAGERALHDERADPLALDGQGREHGDVAVGERVAASARWRRRERR